MILVHFTAPLNGFISNYEYQLTTTTGNPASIRRPHGVIYSADEWDSPEAEQGGGDPQGGIMSTASDQDKDRQILAANSILGYYEDSNGPLANWMTQVDDNVRIVDMNIPGTHDSATWNYTDATQTSLLPITGTLPPAIAFQCQSRSLFQMLGDGIRFFDLRIGFLPDHERLGFYHAAALLSSEAYLEDVFEGFYKWLRDHSTETLLVSIKVDNATFGVPESKKQIATEKLQRMVYKLLVEDGKDYWVLKDSELSTLGECRGKMIFIQRIDWDQVRADPNLQPLGIPLPPPVFLDNHPNFEIIYNNNIVSNTTGAGKAYVEDYYNILPNPTSVQNKVSQKVDAVLKHLHLAATSSGEQNSHPDGLFITFTSGGALLNTPPVTPKTLALGTQTIRGVNQQLFEALVQEQLLSQDRSKSRLGIVILDWYFHTPGLVESIIGLHNTENNPAT